MLTLPVLMCSNALLYYIIITPRVELTRNRNLTACFFIWWADYSGTSDKGPSEIGTTSLQRTTLLAPKCPLFGGSTVLGITETSYHAPDGKSQFIGDEKLFTCCWLVIKIMPERIGSRRIAR